MSGAAAGDPRARAPGVGAEAWVFGACAGAVHAGTEIALVGAYGARVPAVDALFIAATWAGLAVPIGAALHVVLRLAGAVGVPLRPRPLCFALLALAYAPVVAEQTLDRATGAAPAAILGGFAAVALVGGGLLGRGRPPFTAVIAAQLALATAAVGAPLAAQALAELPTPRARAAVCAILAALPAAALAVLLLLHRSGPRADPARDRARGVAAAGALLLAALAFGMGPLPAALPWHVLGAAEPPAGPAASEGRPNVLLVVLDTVRARSLDLFGYARETMPRLRRFAESEADHFAAMMANSAATLPSHGSIFTGHFVYSHGAHSPLLVDEDPPAYGYPMRGDLPTLAEWLGRAGYRSACISANYGVLSGYGLTRGFDHVDVQLADASRIRAISWPHAVTLAGRSLADWIADHLLPASSQESDGAFNRWIPDYRVAARINARAIEWLERQPDAPFLLFLNYFDAHDPYLPRPGYRYRFTPPDPGLRWTGFPHESFDAMMAGGPTVPEREVAFARDMYDAELAYLDDRLAELFDHLRETDVYRNTLILVVGDHGEAFMEHGIMKHGSMVYDTQVSVPLIVKLPERSRARPLEVAASFQHVDFLPSILDAVGLEVPPGVQGSAWGRGRAWSLAEKYVFPADHPIGRRELAAVRIGRFKYIRSSGGGEELYDVRADPGELRDLIGSAPASTPLAELRAVADERERRLAGRVLEEPEEDEALLERLRALGYVE